MTVVSGFDVKGDLTLVSRGDITVNADGSLQSGGTLTLAALGDFIPGSQGNISDTNTSEARFPFDAPEVTFFANNEAGTLANPLTVKSGSNTVNVGAGTGVAYFDGAPGNMIGSGPVIQSMFDSFQSIDINLDEDILNTKIVEIPPEQKPLPPELTPPEEYLPRVPEPPSDPVDIESEESQWNSEVSQVATLDQWMETGPRFPDVIDMSNLHMETLIVPGSTVVAYFKSLSVGTKPVDDQTDISKIVFTFSLSTNGSPFYTSKPEASEPGNGVRRVIVKIPGNLEQLSERGSIVGFNMVATGSNGKPAPIRLVSIASYTASAEQNSTEATVEADKIVINSDTKLLPLRLASLGSDTEYTKYIPAGYVVPDTEVQLFNTGTAAALLMVATTGDAMLAYVDGVTSTAESIEHGIDHISFGPPALIHPGETTIYRFHTLDDFARAELIFRTVNPTHQNESTFVNSARLQGIRSGEWVGKDDNRRWEGVKKGMVHGSEEGHRSIGLHELQINAWNRQDIVWQSRWSDDRVTVLNGD
jgi:hypothetical protein